MLKALLLVIMTLAIAPRQATAQARPPLPRDTNLTHVLLLADGSTLVGKLISRDSSVVRFETNGGVFTVPVARVKELRELTPSEVRGDEYWFPDANETRLFFAPTGRMLKKGDGYYSNTYLLLQNFVGAPSDQFTFGGGFSIVPSDNFIANNIYYVTPKVGVYNTPKANFAVGALLGVFPGSDFNNGPETFGILYGVGTRGGPEASMTAGLGYGFANGRMQDRPLIMLGGSVRTARRISLVTENYALWTREPELTCTNTGCVETGHRNDFNGLLSYGLRFMGEKISVDFALLNATAEFIFPGIPYIAFGIKF